MSDFNNTDKGGDKRTLLAVILSVIVITAGFAIQGALFPSAPAAMASGSSGTVAITVASATNVIRVPVSALAGVTSGTGTVEVLAAGSSTPKSTAVTLGAIGGGWAQVLSGLTKGQIVVLADASQALPANQTQSTRGFGTGGGFGGGGTGGGTGGTRTGGGGGTRTGG